MKDDIFLGMKIEYAKSVPAFWRRVVRWDVHTCSLTWRNVRRTRRQQIPSRYAVECTKSCRSPWTSCRGVASGRPSRPDPISYDQLQHPLVGVAALGEIMRPNILFDVRGACSSVIVHDMWARLFWLMCIKCCSGVRCCAKIIFGRASFAHTHARCFEGDEADEVFIERRASFSFSVGDNRATPTAERMQTKAHQLVNVIADAYVTRLRWAYSVCLGMSFVSVTISIRFILWFTIEYRSRNRAWIRCQITF